MADRGGRLLGAAGEEDFLAWLEVGADRRFVANGDLRRLQGRRLEQPSAGQPGPAERAAAVEVAIQVEHDLAIAGGDQLVGEADADVPLAARQRKVRLATRAAREQELGLQPLEPGNEVAEESRTVRPGGPGKEDVAAALLQRDRLFAAPRRQGQRPRLAAEVGGRRAIAGKDFQGRRARKAAGSSPTGCEVQRTFQGLSRSNSPTIAECVPRPSNSKRALQRALWNVAQALS